MKRSRWTILLSSAALAGGMVPALPNIGVPRADALDVVEILGPAGSVAFGDVTVLPNGNFVVTDPGFVLSGVEDVGAVYLYNGSTNALISRLRGGGEDDRVGNLGIAVVGGSNFVVLSGSWRNGVVPNVGAATWVNGVTGLDGSVSAQNSLVGSHADDFTSAAITSLTNGNYVVSTPFWDKGNTTNHGAATWGHGAAGVTGAINTLKSLTGEVSGDFIASGGVVALSNGHYVVDSPLRDRFASSNAGAATWGNGDTGTVGIVIDGNSTYGTAPGYRVSSSGTIALSNGNYVVLSADWANAGAATWRTGNGPSSGPVNLANSMIAGQIGDFVGATGIALTNGNYVVATPYADFVGFANVGMVRWGNGATGTTGTTTTANSIHGTNAGDFIGDDLDALTNGNYVVASPSWNGGRGAVTWAAGDGPTSFAVGAANSLAGATAFDNVGEYGVTPLVNGNYVVASPSWSKGPIFDAGAVTWGNGATGITGNVSETNSLTGTQTADEVGSGGLVALTNGNYQVISSQWHDQGAVTWGNGAVATAIVVSVGNSVTGVGASGGVGFSEGSAAIVSPAFDKPGLADVGAVTLVSGSGPTSGAVSDAISVFGRDAGAGESITVGTRLTASGAVAVGWSSDNRVVLFKHSQTPPGQTPDFVPVPPARLADTRPGGQTVDGQFAGTGQRAAGATLELMVTGRGGVPVDAAAVALNVTITEGVQELFVTVFPCGQPRPTASSLNANAGSNVPNAVIARVGTGGKACIYTSQATHLVVDVTGYFPAATRYRPLNPARLIDTRPGEPTIDGQQSGGGKIAANTALTVHVHGRGGVPMDADTAVLNVTVTGADGPLFVTVYPCGQPRPTASNLNVVPGITAANLAVTKIGTGGDVCVYTQVGAHLIVDVNGYFPPATHYNAINPARLLDTRPGQPTVDGQQSGGGPVAAGATIAVQVTGRGGVPASATAVALNVTVSEPQAAGFVTVYPCGISPPLASNVNYAASQTIPNAAIVKVGTGGQVCLYTLQTAHLIVDVSGAFAT